MPDAVLYALVVVVALACPAHMWLTNRRGKRALCCPPRRHTEEAPADVEALRARQREVEARLAELDVDAPTARRGGGRSNGAPLSKEPPWKAL